MAKKPLISRLKFVVSTWPHKLSIPDIINGIIGRLSGASGVISRYNGQSKKKLLSDFGEEKYDELGYESKRQASL